ncbi:hypothetical protein LDENG_00003110 [Lucifuga dentata]|nr:hypothetical protein LDENG_00003110 [Lucifuga dentata]
METWFLNHVFGLFLSILLLVLPGPLGATWTPSHGNNTVDPVTRGYFHSAATDGVSITENNVFTDTGSTSQLHTASGRNLHAHTAGTHAAQTHSAGTHTAQTQNAGKHTSTAGHTDTEQTQTLTETSSGSLEGTTSLYTEPIISTLIVATTEASSDWEDLPTPEQVSHLSPALPLKTRSWMVTEETRLPQDSPDSTLRQGDTTALVSQTAVVGIPIHTDSIYTSTTISRAGERTLLSVTSSSSSSSSNSTSSMFTEDSSSHQPPSTWGIAAKGSETENSTDRIPFTRTDDGEMTHLHQHTTESTEQVSSETESPAVSGGTQTLTEQPNVTQHQHVSTSEGVSKSTPPLGVTASSTDQSEVSVLSTTPVISLDGGPTNISVTVQGSNSSVETSTESSTSDHSSVTQDQEGMEGVSSQTREESMSQSPTTAPPTVSTGTDLDDSLTSKPVLATEVFLTTTPITTTERRLHFTEDETFKTTTSSTTTTPIPSPATTSPTQPSSTSSTSSTSSSSAWGSPTQGTIQHTASATTASTLGQQTSAAPIQHLSTSHTQEPSKPSTEVASFTNATTLQLETSTATLRTTVVHSEHATATYSHSSPSPTRSTEALYTTLKQTDRATTPLVLTTASTDVRPTKAPPRNPCVSNPCMNGGMCVSYEGRQFTCHCQQAWTGLTCNMDVDECEQDPCPFSSRCVNTRGSFSCECPLGFDLEDGRTCTKAKTFLGTFSVNRPPRDRVIFKSTIMHEIQREIIQLLNASLSVIRGYSRSTLSKKEEDSISIFAVNMFSISTDVTSAEVYNSIQMSLSNCSSSLTHCRMVLLHQLTYHAESLCSAQKTQCDTERSICTDNSGTASCQCLRGYYKHSPDDLSCLDCGDGYKLENGTCVQCMFGFGGFNCGNFYKLIAVVVSPAGGGLLLILIIALIVTCCKKDKNDINKIIFKSGDLQMSPYADFPKSNRVSVEWGRETIEMQENGSTKNLLQMTDIYYSPALRNSDLERNGLYPFTGLPGSRHSCIYPAQWNPSFISDDSRRRDYF